MAVYKIKKKTDTANNTEEIKFPISSVDGLQSALDALAGGGGGITEIADQSIRIWDLDVGIYKLTYSGIKYIYYNGASASSAQSISGTPLLWVSKGSTTKNWLVVNDSSSIRIGSTSSLRGEYYMIFASNILQKSNIIDNLTSDSNSDTLSANQGRVLKGLIDDLQTQIDNIQPTNATVTNNSDGTVDISITNMPSA